VSARKEPRSSKSCHERALGLLAVRPRSRRELERRLLGAGFEGQEVDDVLVRLERVGLVDDAAFARQVVEHRFGNRSEGRRAVSTRLRAAGVAPDVVTQVLDDVPDDEEARADELAKSRAGRLRGVAPEKAFARLSSLLMRRGYGPQIARSAARKALEIQFLDE
jgi:regulatory protein